MILKLQLIDSRGSAEAQTPLMHMSWPVCPSVGDRLVWRKPKSKIKRTYLVTAITHNFAAQDIVVTAEKVKA